MQEYVHMEELTSEVCDVLEKAFASSCANKMLAKRDAERGVCKIFCVNGLSTVL
jgi:hypothetical protein